MVTHKKLTLTHTSLLLLILFTLPLSSPIHAQEVSQIRFCDKKYEYAPHKDSITLFLKVLDADGNRAKDLTARHLEKYLVLYEDGNIIPESRRTITSLSSGRRIPADLTFSVLVDLSIPQEGKTQIFQAVRKLVESAPDSCVYLSFFGDEVSASQMVTTQNINSFKNRFLSRSDKKYFYGALYAKLAEFSPTPAQHEADIDVLQQGYTKNADIVRRASAAKDKNLLFVFTEGSKRPEDEPVVGFMEVTDYQNNPAHHVPRVYAFYYTGNGIEENVKDALQGVTTPRDTQGQVITDRTGLYKPSDDLANVLADFQQVVKDAMYDFAFTYQATQQHLYTGKTAFKAEWKGEERGAASYSIGTAENPWPVQEETAAATAVKYLFALLITLLTVAFFFIVTKVFIPWVKSKAFAAKYYRKYLPEANIQRRICHYCRQEIRPGQMVVAKCQHIMHVHCWQENGYKCSEYGQNCKAGIQPHTDFSGLLSKSSLLESLQVVSGVVAGLVSWIIYELLGRGAFHTLARKIVRLCFTNEAQRDNLFDTCVTQVAAFLTIGLLLAFFLSLTFRWNDEYRKKDWKACLKIVLLSLFSAVVGLLAFAVGAAIFCLLLSAVGTTYIPWYCALPAYLLFSVCTSLSLTVMSSVPMKSALIGGICSAVIGFLVLYFSHFASVRGAWMNMLLLFIIYGGGLGASLVTVRMLAEKYFLVIINGIKAGQRIPIHKWMNATGGGNKVSIGITGECEIQMNWEKSNKVAKEHAQLFIDPQKTLPVIKPLAAGVVYNSRSELPVAKTCILTNGDTFKIGDTIFQYVEN